MRISDWSSDVCSSDLNLPCHVAAFCAWIMADNDRLRQCADEAIGFTGQARHPPARDGARQWRRAFAAEARTIRRPRYTRYTRQGSHVPEDASPEKPLPATKNEILPHYP